MYFNPLLGAAPLLTGCALAIALDDERVRSAVVGAVGRVATWLGAAALVVGALWIDDDWTQRASTFGVVMPAAGVAAAVLVGGLVTTDTVLARGLAVRPVSWFGRRVSYSAYLWHPMVIALLTPLMPGRLGELGMVAAALVVATGATYAVEVPVERLRARLRAVRAVRAGEDARRDRADRAPVTERVAR